MKKKSIKLFVLIPLLFIISGCDFTPTTSLSTTSTSQVKIDIYAAIQINDSPYYEYNYMLTDPVYHVNKDKKIMQPQPYQNNNKIYNVDAPWQEYRTIELLTSNLVYDHVYTLFDDREMKLVNDSEIDIYKIVYHTKLFDTITINEVAVIDIKDIVNFEFDYKIDF